MSSSRTRELVSQLVHSFAVPRQDNDNSVLAGLPKSAIMPIKHVQKVAARPILDLRMSDHVTPAMRQLHWLPVDMRVNYKLCTMMHSFYTRQRATFSANMVYSVAANLMRFGLRSADSAKYQQPRCRMAIGEGRFRMLVLTYGTLYLHRFITS